MGQGHTCDVASTRQNMTMGAEQCGCSGTSSGFSARNPTTDCEGVCGAPQPGSFRRSGSWHELRAAKTGQSNGEVEVGGRELEDWLQGVLGQKCKEAKWAREDHGLFQLPTKEAERIVDARRQEVVALQRAALERVGGVLPTDAQDQADSTDAPNLAPLGRFRGFASTDDAKACEDITGFVESSSSTGRPLRPDAFGLTVSSEMVEEEVLLAPGSVMPVKSVSRATTSEKCPSLAVEGEVILQAPRAAASASSASTAGKRAGSAQARANVPVPTVDVKRASVGTSKAARATSERRGRRPLTEKEERASEMMLW